jgi:hypothetical protein
MSTLYLYEDYQSLQLTGTFWSVQKYHAGTKMMVHLPVDWEVLSKPRLHQLPDESQIKLREMRAGDEIGLAAPSAPRIAMTKILHVRRIRLHEVSSDDLVRLGQPPEDFDGYRDYWNMLWSIDLKDGGPWPWENNPEVYAIYWEPLALYKKTRASEGK